jgi:metal-sulfur cluster biosynthetic enzyme
MSTSFDEAISQALEQVCDPCSIAANAPVSILDMGLVRTWSVDDQANLIVRMCVTSASCTMGPHMVRAAEELLSKIPGLNSVKVEIDAAVFWSPKDMNRRGREILEERRSSSLAKSTVTPQQWRVASHSTRPATNGHGATVSIDRQSESSA